MYQSALRYGSFVVKAYSCLDIVNFILSNLIRVSKYIIRIILKLTLWFTMTIIKLFNSSSESFYPQCQSWFIYFSAVYSLSNPAKWGDSCLVTNPQNFCWYKSDSPHGQLCGPHIHKWKVDEEQSQHQPCPKIWRMLSMFQRPFVFISGSTPGTHAYTVCLNFNHWNNTVRISGLSVTHLLS